MYINTQKELYYKVCRTVNDTLYNFCFLPLSIIPSRYGYCISDDSLLNIKISKRGYKKPSGDSSSNPTNVSSDASNLSEGTVKDLVSNNTLDELKAQKDENIEECNRVKSMLDEAIVQGNSESVESLQKEYNEWMDYSADVDKAIEQKEEEEEQGSSSQEDPSTKTSSSKDDDGPKKGGGSGSGPSSGGGGGESSSSGGGSSPGEGGGGESSSSGGGSSPGEGGGSFNKSLQDIAIETGVIVGGVIGQIGEMFGGNLPF